MKSFFILTLLLPLIHSTIAIAQNIVALQRIVGSIELDGISDEEAWLSITPYPLTMNSPVFKGEPTEMTEIKIGYDDNFIYAAGKFYDSDPSGIRGNSYERDGSNPGDARGPRITTTAIAASARPISAPLFRLIMTPD